MPETKLPKDFESQMLELLGHAEFEHFEKAINKSSRTSIRLNPAKCFTPYPLKAPIPWAKQGYFLEQRPTFTLDPAFHAGAYYVQEASSQFIEHILDSLQIPKGIYLDLAAAPGGKSTLLSSYLADEGMLLANEVIQTRAQVLKENIIKWGWGNTLVTNNDPEHFTPLEGFFDLVLVDAPCSGEGMFRKDMQAREEWSPDHVQFCAARQKRIMDQAGALVKAEGYLLYSTCTFNVQENEEMIRFLTSEFSYEPVRIPLEESWNIKETEVEADGKTYYGYRFLPHMVQGEGFFVSVLKRTAGANTQVPKRIKDFKHPYLKEVSKQDSKALDVELDFNGNGKYYLLKDSYFRMNKNWNLHFQKVSQHLNLKYFGVEIGKKQQNKWIPTHEWALSILPNNKFPSLDLPENQAIAYLRKNELKIADLPKGWVLITYHNLPLGWVKNIGNRVNNYYPKEWRIRI
ncbi:tRNA/rRNA cytosine-C5-methylase [Algoriphagus halophytocola]|uniref:methyltransferase RsmF C-terminal domain-like protein n=1 Tax=Algoriphagus halophytocola TaxID=2991499 RepID=UPI0022DE6590|nr:tRNA/rRNA cytosine-C5-methylase [Algoriphagus sp. TR-M9]WBL42779.1 tRNA/rRNA cytosine-C5-methylase [Algoriphagus sp. TR-M9]